MSSSVFLKLQRLVCWAFGASCSASVLAVAVLVGTSISAPCQGVGEILGTSEAIAENLSTDVTRLALQVAAISMSLNLVLFLAHIRIMAVMLAKPCMMPGQIAAGILRDAAREVVAAMAEAKK
jgi:hypothetical protein